MEVHRRHLMEGKRSPQLIERWEAIPGRYIFYCPETLLEVSIIAPHLLRFRFSVEGYLDNDFSYALASEELPLAEERDYRMRVVGDEFYLETNKLTCIISKTLHIRIIDQDGTLISEDERGFHWEPVDPHGGYTVYCNKKIQQQENFYGLGDKSSQLNLRGLRFENWGSDTYGFEKTSDPLYKAIPFFMGLHHFKAYGIFFDNTFRTNFDFGYERNDVCKYWAGGGEMCYYFIYGPELVKVAESYTMLTGTAELPPLWALGYHQSKWSYAPESKVIDIARQLREHQIPCDAIHIDIDYMDGFRVFTWDAEKFPDPKRMHAELEADGFKTVVILDPGVKIDRNYPVHQEGLRRGMYCRRADGPLMQGQVWPGMCHFPDFTHPRVRAWWKTLIGKFLETGPRGIWNDMNEPAVLHVGTFPLDTRHYYEGKPCSHLKAHNVYGMQMARAAHEGMRDALYPYRPFGLTRSGYAGFQRYAATWTGDNLATWEHLWMANVQCQRLSVSGVSFCGSDIGGFIGDTNGELLTRWTQLGAFQPFFRNHSSGDYKDQEPWAFGEPYTDAIRQAIEWRYAFLPYLYTAFSDYVRYGTPMLLPLSFIDQTDPETYYRMDEFGVGRDLLVCPVIQPGATSRKLYLPKEKWINYWTDQVMEGQQEWTVEAPLDRMPIFVRPGAIIPNYPVMQYVGEKRITELDMHLYYSDTSYTSSLYEDAGDYFDYEQGNFMVRIFNLTSTPADNQIRVHQLKKGRYNAEYPTLRFHLHAFPFPIKSCIIDGNTITLSQDSASGRPTFRVGKNFNELIING